LPRSRSQPSRSLACTIALGRPSLRLGRLLDSGLALHRSIDVHFLMREIKRLRVSGRLSPDRLVKLIEMRAPDAVQLDSALERRFLAALKKAGLPRPKEHYDVVEGGVHIAEVDFAFPRLRVAIQVHGAAVHRRYGVWQRDQDQSSELAAAGWLVLYVTWAHSSTEAKTR
jgi:hypothetical protein